MTPRTTPEVSALAGSPSMTCGLQVLIVAKPVYTLLGRTMVGAADRDAVPSEVRYFS